MSTHHVCAQGHQWQSLAACPVCGAAPRPSGEPTAFEPGTSGTLPADALPPAVSALPTLELPDPAGESGAARSDLPRVAGYETIRVLGRGGMGVVYLAWQTGLARLVALKTVLAGAHAGPEQRARFCTEAEAAARLQHSYIVPIYEVGEADGQPYLVMEYVEGGSLAARLNGKPQPWQAAVALVATLADAVHHAHRRGIVHRDLKPANILLSGVKGQESGVSGRRSALLTPDSCPLTPGLPPDPWPKITDFGLAKLLVGGVTQTASGAILGTPGYMAPEQAAGASAPVGPAADIHALGAILYELLTGRPPFQGADVLETLEQVRSVEPVAPRGLVATIPRDVETVCLKCLRKEPDRRYDGALALAEDLRRCAAGEPVRARPVGPWERGVKWLRRHPARAALLAVSCLAALALAGIAVGLPYSVRLRAVNADLTATAARVESARADLDRLERRVRYVRDVHLADEAWQDGLVQRLPGLLERCPRELRGWE